MRPRSWTGWCWPISSLRSSLFRPMPTSTDPLATPASPWHIRELSALDRQTFVERLGFLFEGSPWIAAEAWDSRPWRTREALHAALLEVVACASQERQLALIRAHPDLVGRAALAGTLMRESTTEQRAAGLDPNA